MAPFRTVCSKLLPVCDHPPAPGAAKGGFRAPNQTRDRNEPDIETTGGSATRRGPPFPTMSGPAFIPSFHLPSQQQAQLQAQLQVLAPPGPAL